MADDKSATKSDDAEPAEFQRSQELQSLSTITEEPTTTTTLHTMGSSRIRPSEQHSSLKQTSTLNLPLVSEGFRLKKDVKLPKKRIEIPPRKFPCYDALGHRPSPPKSLFATVVRDKPKRPTPKMLITGFGLRNIESLQDALRLQDENTRLHALYQSRKDSTQSIAFHSVPTPVSSSECSETQTEETPPKSETQSAKGVMKYLMGLGATDEEEEETRGVAEMAQKADDEDILLTGATESMKQAQKYLRTHRIFEFFQFILAHMLSALPENPIDFIIDLLDKCLVYRSGLMDPPLLYNHKHLECFFNLMDRMKTGVIEVKQYHTGMKTLQICAYEKKPQLTADGMVEKTVFIEEAYECLTNMLNDMIRRRWLKTPAPESTPPSTQVFFRTPPGSTLEEELSEHSSKLVSAIELPGPFRNSTLFGTPDRNY